MKVALTVNLNHKVRSPFFRLQLFHYEHRLCASLREVELVRSLFLCVQLLHKVHQLCASLRDAKLVRSLFLCVNYFTRNIGFVPLCVR